MKFVNLTKIGKNRLTKFVENHVIDDFITWNTKMELVDLIEEELTFYVRCGLSTDNNTLELIIEKEQTNYGKMVSLKVNANDIIITDC